MKKVFHKFAEEEFGNAVIDWMVLTAGVVLLAVAIVATTTSNMSDITDNTSEVMENMNVTGS